MLSPFPVNLDLREYIAMQLLFLAISFLLVKCYVPLIYYTLRYKFGQISAKEKEINFTMK